MVSNAKFDVIYQRWVDYADNIDKTVTEALTASIGTYMQSVREFTLWELNQKNDDLGALRLTAKYAQEDLASITKTLGVTGVTVENFTNQYAQAVKNSFDPNTITQWDALGDALRSSTDAQTAYNQAIVSAANNLISAQMAVNNALGIANTTLQRSFLVNEANQLLSKAVNISPDEAAKHFQNNYNTVASNSIDWQNPYVQSGTYNDYIKKMAEIYTLDHQPATTAQSYTPATYSYAAANNTVSLFTGLLDGLVESLGDNASTLKSAYNTAQSMLNTLNADNVEYQVAQFKRYTAEADSYSALVRANPFDTVVTAKFADALDGAQDYIGAYLDPSRFNSEYDFKFAQLSTQNKLETYKATASLNTIMEDILSELKVLKETATSQAQINAAIARFEQRASAVLEGIANGSITLRTEAA